MYEVWYNKKSSIGDSVEFANRIASARFKSFRIILSGFFRKLSRRLSCRQRFLVLLLRTLGHQRNDPMISQSWISGGQPVMRSTANRPNCWMWGPGTRAPTPANATSRPATKKGNWQGHNMAYIDARNRHQSTNRFQYALREVTLCQWRTLR